MSIPVFHLKRLHEEHAQEINELLTRVAASGVYLFGPEKEKFEVSLADFLGTSRSSLVTCHSGTDALVLSLLAAGVQSGHEVITVTNSAIPTAAAIVQASAKPVFCGVNESSWLMDLSSCRKLLSPRTKAIIPVHLFGNAFDVDGLRAMLDEANRSDVAIIEDAAQAFGSTLRGRPLGTLGDFGSFSFYPTKNLGALGDGGAVWAKNPDHAKKIQALAFYGQTQRNEATFPRGFNSRLDEIQSSVLHFRLGLLSENIARRAHLMDKYRTGLKDVPLKFPLASPESSTAWHLAVVRTPSFSVRERLRKFLSEKNIETMVHYPMPLHQQAAFCQVKESSTSPGEREVERLSSEILTLPFSHAHADLEVKAVIGAVQKFDLWS